jgi:uncharacterized phiE125 gp8 family phage protein
MVRLLPLSNPAEGPVALSTLRTYLRVDGTQDDIAIQTAFRAARQHITRRTHFVLAVESWRLSLDELSADQTIEVPLYPFRRVTSARFHSGSGSSTSIATTNLSVRSMGRPAYLRLNQTISMGVAKGGLEIDCECGYSNGSDVPPALTLAALRATALYYETRGDEAALLNDQALAQLMAPFIAVRLT